MHTSLPQLIPQRVQRVRRDLEQNILARGERKLVGLLRDIERLPLTLDRDDIIRMQATCLRHGINKVGVPDLIIAQHARQNDLSLFM